MWIHAPDEKMEQIAEITQMLHNASLLLDDIEDGSERRRGVPAAHIILGTPAYQVAGIIVQNNGASENKNLVAQLELNIQDSASQF